MTESTTYQPPTTGLVSYLPASWVPYAELMRLDRPGGCYALYVLCLFGVAYASTSSPVQLSLTMLADRATTLLLCCLLARGAACTWNDYVDKDFDQKVSRCRTLPLARGAVTPLQAYVWASVQTIAILLILLRFPSECTTYFLGIVIISAIYPFAKRFTYYPQFVMGCVFSTGLLTSVRALDVDPLADEIIIPSLCLFAANVVWTMIYDTIYAHQDIADDVHAGVKSMAVQFRDSTKFLISFLGIVMMILLAMTGSLTGLGLMYFISVVGGSAVSLAATVALVDLSNPQSCAWWFSWGFLFVGGSILAGFAAEYAQPGGERSQWRVKQGVNVSYIHADL